MARGLGRNAGRHVRLAPAEDFDPDRTYAVRRYFCLVRFYTLTRTACCAKPCAYLFRTL